MTDPLPLGRLERVLDIRQVWPGEATHFTPWLAQSENISLLGEAIGVDLEVEAQEKNVGPFRADILCKETVTGHYVLIENQVERTDHTHLGQLLTYAAGLDAITVVWVARQFADEHRAALDWLNRATGEGINFFGLEIELWRIGESAIAPKFNVISQPNDWSDTVKEQAAVVSSTALTSFQQLHLEFWSQLRKFIADRAGTVIIGKPSKESWTTVGLGRTYFALAAANGMRDNDSLVYVILSGPNAKKHFHLIQDHHQTAIEAMLGPVEWRLLPNNKESQICITRASQPSRPETWPELISWMAKTLEDWATVFRPIIKELDASEYVDPDEVIPD